MSSMLVRCWLSIFNVALPTALPNPILFGATAKKQYYWQAPAQCAASVGPTPLIAPILTLASSELLEVTRYLSLHDLTFLYLSGNRALWSRIVGVTREASSTHLFDAEGEHVDDLRILRFNPFPLLSTMRMLRTVKLHRVSWFPAASEASPLALLPSGLDRLELTMLPLGYASTSSFRLFRDFDYKTAFPRLRALRISHHSGTEDATEPTLSFPSSLTVLELRGCAPPRSVLRCLSGDPTLAYPEHYAPEAPSSPSRAFPTLAVLDVSHIACITWPRLSVLPPSLTHFGWTCNSIYANNSLWHPSEYHDYDDLATNDGDLATNGGIFASTTSLSSSAVPSNTSAAVGPRHSLRSLYLANSNGNSTGWYRSCPNLTSLKFWDASDRPMSIPSGLKSLRLIYIAADRHVTFNEQLINSGAQLASLVAADLIPCNGENEHQQLIASLQSLTHLRLLNPNDWVIHVLPSTLTSLTMHNQTPSASFVKALPPNLIRLSLGRGLELSLVPLLPRSILHLRVALENTERFDPALFQVANGHSVANADLKLRLIQTGTHVIFGLPPNLLSLDLISQMDVMQFDGAEFGAFLPRSLRILTANVQSYKIVLKSTASSTLSRLGSWLGVSKPITEESLLAEVLGTFPPHCACNLHVYIETMLRSKKVPLAVFKRIGYPEAAYDDD